MHMLNSNVSECGTISQITRLAGFFIIVSLRISDSLNMALHTANCLTTKTVFLCFLFI